MFELTCSIQNYEWGKLGTDSKVAVLYKNANPDYVIEDGTPYAELWMGTHINGPSRLKSGDTLSNVIHDTPARLGRKVLDKFGSELPFLFKVLSIHKALSIQVHPSKRHAERLHADRPDLYKDPNHKPELAIALTPFEALCGFRPISQIKNFFKVVPELKGVIGEKIVDDFVRCDEVDSEKYLRKCFEALMTCSPETVTSQLKKALERFANLGVQERIEQCSTLIERLHEQFPNDVGCFVVYFLNVIELQPNEAIYLGANEPHAYLSGDCVECMACSDNVVRAGLTPKYKDVATLCSMLNYEGRPAGAKLFKPVVENDSSQVFRPPVPDFAVVKIEPAEKNKFSCEGRPSGYYADVRSGCQIYHMCDGLGRQFSYSCPNTTLFQQRMLICDHWYMVNCSRSENDYEANLLIGQNKPFVEDSNKHPYHRTPRPDLLSQPTAAEYDIVYRTVRTKHQDNSNVVGADSDQNNSSYNLPSHWSTEYSKEDATRRPARIEPPIDAANRNKTPKAISFNANLNDLNPTNKDNPPVNFKSLFKNTTPVFPTREQLTTPSTTGEEEVLQQPAVAKSPIGDLPLKVRPPLFENFNRNDTTFGSTAPPSKFYEPPNFAPNFYKDSATEENRYSASEAKNAKKIKVNARQSNEKILKDLRKMFSIPDYEFPLDNNNASRPSYNDGPSSFQVNPFLSNFTQRQHS